MNLPTIRNPNSVPDRIPINDPLLLAKLWEKEEIRARQVPLMVIAEHIDLHNADLTILAWERVLSLFEHLDRMYALNMENARTNARHLGIELPNGNEGADALSEVLKSIVLADTAKFPSTKIHPSRHLVCNIGVLRAGTVMKTAYALARSTYINEPTTGLLELMSRLDEHQQALGSDILEYRNRAHLELANQGYDVRLWSIMPELGDLNQSGVAYWRITP